MKIVAISGSPRNKKTNYMISKVLESAGLDVKIIELRKFDIKPCINCHGCWKDFTCQQRDDMHNIYPQLDHADVILLGTPTYFDNVSGIMKNFMDRCLPYYLSRKLEGKKAALVTGGGFKKIG